MNSGKFSQKSNRRIAEYQEFDTPLELSDELFEVSTGAGPCGISCSRTCCFMTTSGTCNFTYPSENGQP